MRKRLIHTILLAGFLCAPAIAQRVEIFGGAQYEHLQSSYNAGAHRNPASKIVSISGLVIESSFSKCTSLEQLITLHIRVAMLELSNVTARSDQSGQASRFRPEWLATRNGHSPGKRRYRTSEILPKPYVR